MSTLFSPYLGKNRIITIFVSLISFLSAMPASSQIWQEILETNFDIVETFDQLQDWKGNCGTGNIQINLPVDYDGSPSLWHWYDAWDVNCDINAKWIANHGAENTWRGVGKSLKLDLDSDNPDGQQGVQRLSTYFGDGTSESGYEELYIFHMVKIYKNQWPTEIDAEHTGTFIEGEPYAYYDSWKFGTLNLGMLGPRLNNAGVEDTYSDYHIIPHIKLYNYEPLYGKLALKLEPNDEGGLGRLGVVANLKSVEDFLPEWWGVEFHFKNAEEEGRTFTYYDIWVYDKAGNTTQVLSEAKTEYTVQPYSHKWNEWFFGGNNSATYSWGRPSMHSPYYIDDFIIDDKRIGTTYFALLNNQPIPESCFDGIQNQDETGIDCGGACDACVPAPNTHPSAPSGLSVQ